MWERRRNSGGDSGFSTSAEARLSRIDLNLLRSHLRYFADKTTEVRNLKPHGCVVYITFIWVRPRPSDGRAIYFFSRRVTGFLNLWGMKFDQTKGAPVGDPFQVTFYESPSRGIPPEIGSMAYALRADRLIPRDAKPYPDRTPGPERTNAPPAATPRRRQRSCKLVPTVQASLSPFQFTIMTLWTSRVEFASGCRTVGRVLHEKRILFLLRLPFLRVLFLPAHPVSC